LSHQKSLRVFSVERSVSSENLLLCVCFSWCALTLWNFVGIFGSVLHRQKEEEKTLENPIEQHLIAVQVRQLGSVLFKFTVLLFIIIQYGRGKQGSKKQPA